MSEPGTGDGVPGPEPQMSEAFAEEAGETGAKMAGEAAGERLRAEGKTEPEIDQQAKEDLSSLLGDAAPGSDKERRDFFIATHTNINERIAQSAETGLDQNDISIIAQQLASLGFRKDDGNIDGYLKREDLRPEEKAAIKESLPPMDDSDREDHEMGETEAAVKGKIGETIKGVAEKTADDIIDDITNNRQDLGDEEKRKLVDRITGLKSRVTDLFAPGEKGRDWARRIGKTLYFALIALFLIVILEMNMINKMSRKK